MKPLPEHLQGMTQQHWDSLSPTQRETMIDLSDLNTSLLTYMGQKVRVTPKRQFGASTFRVGKTTGWRPAMLAIRGSARGSSDVIHAAEIFTSIERVK